MNRRTIRILLVESISLLRLLGVLVFAFLAFNKAPRPLLFCIYALAMSTDMIDGYLSRRLGVESYLGMVLDLVADKSLTMVSLLYAGTLGINLLPLALIATRDLLMIGLRLITVQGRQLMPTNRLLGGTVAFLLWGNTLALMLEPSDGRFLWIANIIYWVCAAVLTVNLILRVYASWDRIMMSLGSPSENPVAVAQAPPTTLQVKAKVNTAR